MYVNSMGNWKICFTLHIYIWGSGTGTTRTDLKIIAIIIIIHKTFTDENRIFVTVATSNIILIEENRGDNLSWFYEMRENTHEKFPNE